MHKKRQVGLMALLAMGLAGCQADDRATDQALDRFRDQPNKLGRARMFGEKSIGLDDPGMLAFRRLLDGLTGERD